MMDNESITGGTFTVTTERRWKFCPFDGQTLQGDWTHCPKCGAAIGQGSPWYVPMPYPVYPQPQPWISWPGTNGIVGGTYTPNPGGQIT